MEVDETLIRRMCKMIKHRGPDESGVYIDRQIGLGHQRLSIIDLSTGQQPMSNERQDIWLVFNGEIYNFPELRRDLELRGYHFRTHSDTEVIIHLYDEYGVDCVTFLRGMFAFGIWDVRRRRLFLARDRVGQKPLFYLKTDDALIFASEIKALLQDKSYRPDMNLAAMFHYLTYQYTPPPETIFQHICKLPPAHTLVAEDGGMTIQRYWDLHFVPKVRMDEHELLESLQSLLEEAVKMRMLSDVPIGAFLSGGIDSSLVVALMSQHSAQAIKTFSIGFAEQDFNELPYARLVAERFGTEHHEFIVKPDAVEILPKLIWHFDEPFGDSSAIPTYYVSQVTKGYVKVALNGDGGDESFAGYLRYLGHPLVESYQVLPPQVRKRLISPILNRLSGKIAQRYWPTLYDSLFRRIKYIHDLSLLSRQHLYARRVTIFPNEEKKELLTDDVRQQLGKVNSLDYMFEYLNAENSEHFTDSMLYSDSMTYLPGDLLVKVDRMTMANSIEGRSPFLDHKLMEFAAMTPAQWKLRKGCLKFLLKAIGKQWFSETFLTRKKQGFGVPVGQWFRQELRDMIHDIFSSSQLAGNGILKKTAMQRILGEHQSGRRDHSYQLWLLLNLELWYRMFIGHE